MSAVKAARQALLLPQFWFDKSTPAPPPEPRLTEGQERNVKILTAEIERQNAELERLGELVKHLPEKPGPTLLADYGRGQAQKAHQEPASTNQRVGSTRPRSHRTLPTDPVDGAKFEAIVDTAWERSQIRAQQLRQIKLLVVTGDKEGIFEAMREFFHLKKPSQGAAHASDKVNAG
jgi:hypothetical protein